MKNILYNFLHFVFVFQIFSVHPTDVSVSIIVSKQNVTAGNPLIVYFHASKTQGLESMPTLSCSGPGGVNLSDRYIHYTIGQQFVTGLKVNFTGIRTSDAGMYNCNATMVTPLLPHPLVSKQSTVIRIKGM